MTGLWETWRAVQQQVSKQEEDKWNGQDMEEPAAVPTAIISYVKQQADISPSCNGDVACVVHTYAVHKQSVS